MRHLEDEVPSPTFHGLFKAGLQAVPLQMSPARTVSSLLAVFFFNETSGRCGAVTNVPWSIQGRFVGSSLQMSTARTVSSLPLLFFLHETSGRCGVMTNVPWSTQGRFAGSSFTDEHDSEFIACTLLLIGKSSTEVATHMMVDAISASIKALCS